MNTNNNKHNFYNKNNIIFKLIIIKKKLDSCLVTIKINKYLKKIKKSALFFFLFVAINIREIYISSWMHGLVNTTRKVKLDSKI